MAIEFPTDSTYPPTAVRVQAMLDAQKAALRDIGHLSRTAARLELYWVTYNFEYRKHIERWLRKDADLKT